VDVIGKVLLIKPIQMEVLILDQDLPLLEWDVWMIKIIYLSMPEKILNHSKILGFNYFKRFKRNGNNELNAKTCYKTSF
jgi:hypothetical protein